jgi:hypothetical protein
MDPPSSPAPMPPPLWRCPDCSRTFANRNQTHTCESLGSIDAHFEKKPPEIRALFDRFADVLQQLGPVSILAEKTRIAFHVRMSFAVAMPRQRWLDGHLVLARRVESPRFRRVETFSPRNHLHAFRLTGLGDFDGEFRDWMAEAYAVGAQQHLLRDAPSPRV